MGKKSKPRFKTDGEVAIHVTDLKKAEAFYGGVLGFKLVEKSKRSLCFDTGELRLYINRDKKVVSFIPALAVKNFKKAKRHLTNNGCHVVKEFRGSKALYFVDPFGILMDIVEK